MREAGYWGARGLTARSQLQAMPVVAYGCALVGILARGSQVEPAGRGLRAGADRARVAALCLELAPVALELVAELAQLVRRSLLAVEGAAGEQLGWHGWLLALLGCRQPALQREDEERAVAAPRWAHGSSVCYPREVTYALSCPGESKTRGRGTIQKCGAQRRCAEGAAWLAP